MLPLVTAVQAASPEGVPSGPGYVITLFGLSALGAVIVALITAWLMPRERARNAPPKTPPPMSVPVRVKP